MKNNLLSDKTHTYRHRIFPIGFVFFLWALTLSSCTGIDQSIGKVKGYLPDIEIGDLTDEGASEKKKTLSKAIAQVKESNFIFSPIISLKDLNKEGKQKNKFFLAGEIYSKNPEESISSLSSENCFSPDDQEYINKLSRLYHVYIKDLGLKSESTNELNVSENVDTYFLIQPILLKYQYCNRAIVEIRYLIHNDTGMQISRTLKNSHKAQDFKLPEKEESHPFFNFNHPGTQFSSLRNALAMAFYKNTLDLIEVILEEHKKNEVK